jgi:predicted nucleotidyltransferase
VDLVALGERLRPALERHGFMKAIVFGSLARGDASRRSDLDLILVKRTNQRFFDRYGDVLYDLYDLAPEREIEALIYTPEELDRLAGRPFIAAALREGKVIYESP